MYKIAVASNDGDQVSENLAGCLLFMIYHIEDGKIVSCEKRAQVLGIPATVHDCHVVVARHCHESVASLLADRGIETVSDRRRSASRAVQGILAKMAVRLYTTAPMTEPAADRAVG
ncbi:MAG: hypothetical protein R3231_10515 [bacterium]|nr:hypothetical protein [bacterium]